MRKKKPSQDSLDYLFKFGMWPSSLPWFSGAANRSEVFSTDGLRGADPLPGPSPILRGQLSVN